MFLRCLFFAGVLIGTPVFFSACDRTPVAPAKDRAALPGRDEVAIAGAYRLSLSADDALKRAFPEVAAEDRVRMGLLAQWWMDQARPDKRDVSTAKSERSLSLAQATRCVRILFLPSLPPKALAEALAVAKQYWGVTGESMLRERMNDAWGGAPVEWNPDLRRDLSRSR